MAGVGEGVRVGAGVVGEGVRVGAGVVGEASAAGPVGTITVTLHPQESAEAKQTEDDR